MQLNPAKTLYAKLQAWIHEQFSQLEPDLVHLQGQYISRYVSMPLNKNLKSKETGETSVNYIIRVIICSSVGALGFFTCSDNKTRLFLNCIVKLHL